MSFDCGIALNKEREEYPSLFCTKILENVSSIAKTETGPQPIAFGDVVVQREMACERVHPCQIEASIFKEP